MFFAANQAGLGIGSSSLLAIGSQVLLTGGLHEDGLADTADGFGGGRDRDAKLAIMEECGFKVTRNPSEMGRILKSLI